MTTQQITATPNEDARQLLREGLDQIGRVQDGLFRQMEKMAAHIVAIEAILQAGAYGQSVAEDSVSRLIRERIRHHGASDASAQDAIGVALMLLRNETAAG
jgi:hypothetical protein